MHCFLPHCSGFSSELSPQSSSPSHFQPRGLQRVLLQWNSSGWQCLVTNSEKEGKKNEWVILSAADSFGVNRPATYHHCHSSLHHCYPCSRHLCHNASGWEYSGHFYTGTDHCRTSHHSRSELRHRMSYISIHRISGQN